MPACLTRRSFFAGAAGAAAWVAVPGRAAAELVCADTIYGTRVCEAGIVSSMIHTAAVDNFQYQSQWCWAACIAMVFEYHGHPVSQARIVREAYGSIVDMPAMPATILAQLNREWVDDNGDPFVASSGFGGTTPDAAARDLADDHPLIVGTQGHAMVLTSMQYQFVPTPFGVQTQLLAAKVRDPWPGNGLRMLRPDEWAMINFAAHIRVQSLGSELWY